MITSFFAKKSGSASKRRRETEDESTLAQPNSRKKTATDPLAVEMSGDAGDLLKHLNDDTGYKQALRKYLAGSKSFSGLATFVATERASTSNTIYPPTPDTFTALNMTPLDSVKVVIVGQDPYHGPSQGHGLCFSVRKGVRIPPSLLNMYKELKRDPNVPNFAEIPKHGYLERWAKQGVLMLNSVLTVRQGQPNSHKGKGWEAFTDEVIRVVAKSAEHPLVFLLWGKPAAAKAKTALAGSGNRHIVISTSHPSPLGATKTKAPFMKSGCFSQANTALKNMGLEPIDWNVDGEDD